MPRRFDTARSEFSPYGFTCETWTPARMPRPDQHNEIELNLLEAGSLSYLIGGRRTTIEVGRLALFWAAIPHQIVDFEGTVPYFVATLPLGDFLEIGIDSGVVNRVLSGELLVEGATDECDRPRVSQWVEELRRGDPACKRAAKLEVQARLLRFANRVSSQPADAHPAPELSRADRLACYIARSYREPLTSQSIAEAAGLHPNYAMTLFRRAFGTTMTTFVTQHRISHAQRLLVTTRDTILEIAFDSGFQSLSRFNEAFKAACGCSPRDYRKAHRAELKAGTSA